MAERGVHVDPSSVFDGVQQFTSLYKDAARPHRRRVGARWSIDETSIRIAGRWCNAFRAIAEEGHVIDVYVSPTRDTAAATAFLTRAVESTEVTPYRATTDKAPIDPPAFAAVLRGVEHVTGKMEQQRTRARSSAPQRPHLLYARLSDAPLCSDRVRRARVHAESA